MAEGWVETYRGTVFRWEVDSNDHLTVAYYFSRFADAGLGVLEAIGLGPSYMRSERRACVTVDCYVRYHQELRAGDKLEMAPLTRMLEAVGRARTRGRPPERFVIGAVDYFHVTDLNAVAHRRGGVVQELRDDPVGSHVEPLFAQLDEVDVRAEILELDGKVRVLHLAGEGTFQGSVQTPCAVDPEAAARDVGGHEEGEALNMVPVGVRHQDVNRRERAPAAENVEAQRSGPGAAVEDKDLAVFGAQLNTVRVAPEERRPAARRGNRSPRAPKPYHHRD